MAFWNTCRVFFLFWGFKYPWLNVIITQDILKVCDVSWVTMAQKLSTSCSHCIYTRLQRGGQANQVATLLSPEVLSSFIVLLKEPLIRRTGPSPEPDVGAALTFCLGRVILSELFQKPKTILIKGHLPGLPAFDWGLPLMITFIEMERKERWVGKNGKGNNNNNNNNSRPGKVKETDVAASALDQRYRMEAVHSIVLPWFDLVWPFGGGRLWGGTCTDLQHCHHMVLVETSSHALLFLSSSSSLCRYISSVDKYK